MHSRRENIQLFAGLGAGMLVGGCASPSSADGGKSSDQALPGPFRIPAEDEPHDGTIMQWPVSKRVHNDPIFLEMLQNAIAKVANTIAEFEPVFICADREYHSDIRALVTKGVELWDIPTEDLWARDSGPTFAFDGDTPIVTHFNFNGWGNKQVHTHDGQIALRVSEHLGLAYKPSTITGEAGGLEWDGRDTLMALESCWVNSNRNRAGKAEITQALLALYGAKTMIWAPGIKGQDITDYHIDSLARFVRPGEVIIQLPEDDGSDDPWVVEPFRTFDILQAAGLKLHVLPTPKKPRVKSIDFVSSYVNYYITNGAVIGAQFGDKASDRDAESLLKTLYKNHEIILLNVDPIGEVGGGIHCATQQIPKGVL